MALPTQILERLSVLGVAPEEVDERFVGGTGPGGQKINKTSSTVWLQHRPTGTEVRCQSERSQAANREHAWEELCSKLEQLRQAAVAQVQSEHERARRQNRQKSRRQKARMVAAKKHRAKIKANRSRGWSD